MFQWDKNVKNTDVPAAQVVHLFRSMRDVQLALPGQPSQMASAYLCQFRNDKGVATVAAFHLHKSNLLAFYFDEPRLVSPDKTDSMLDQGLTFIESMGFLMSDLDIHLLEGDDKKMLWESLPLQKGVDQDEAAPAAQASAKPAPETARQAIEPGPTKAEKPSRESATEEHQAQEPVAPIDDFVPDEAEGVDDLLAAVDAMRAKRPGLRARRKAIPSADEIRKRREELRENIGRILASL